MKTIDLKTAMANAQAERAKAVERAQVVSDQIKSLDTEIKGLELAIARYTGSPTPPTLAPEEQRRWQKMSRTDAIIETLRAAEEPLSPIEITTRLQTVGRSDERNAVAAAIAYLKREDRVHSLGRGKWVVGPDPEPRPESSWDTFAGEPQDGGP